MANIKSQEKRIEIGERNCSINSSRKSQIHTATKKVEALVKEGKKEEAIIALRNVISLLDSYSKAGSITVNSANRKKAHLTHLVNEMK